MILFSKDREIILKITNAILLFWLVGALVFTSSCIIDLAYKEPKYTYDEYSINNCDYFIYNLELTEKEKEDRCKKDYDIYITNYDNNTRNLDNKKQLSMAITNVVIVGGAMVFLNKKRITAK